MYEETTPAVKITNFLLTPSNEINEFIHPISTRIHKVPLLDKASIFLFLIIVITTIMDFIHFNAKTVAMVE